MTSHSKVFAACDDLDLIAARAVRTVPSGLSSGSRRVIALAVASCVAGLTLTAAGGPAAFLIWGIVLSAVLFRALALAHISCPPPPRQQTAPDRLPRVTVLLPLYGEQSEAAGLVAAISAMDYPDTLLEVICLLEEGDAETAAALDGVSPGSWRIVVVPAGRPRTKARACNVGLALATGEIVVVFDGEDRPEADQALKAVTALLSDARLAAVQARLACDHSGAGNPWLARAWALEYAVHFGAMIPALARLRLPFLLGGSSNWFRADALRSVGGWDAHNVTEDADLAVRLARRGWRLDVIDSTTWEEAPVELGDWLKQRSRWIKGFAVTTAEHFMRPRRLVGDLGLVRTAAIVAQLPASLICAAAHPVGLVQIVFALTGGSWPILGIACYGLAVALYVVVARREGFAVWLALVSPLYWLLHSGALVLAVVDLLRSPSHWRKTRHGVAERPSRGAGGVKRQGPRRGGALLRRLRPRRRPSRIARHGGRPARRKA